MLAVPALSVLVAWLKSSSSVASMPASRLMLLLAVEAMPPITVMLSPATTLILLPVNLPRAVVLPPFRPRVMSTFVLALTTAAAMPFKAMSPAWPPLLVLPT